MAQQKCADIGRRLCTLNELSGNKCCERGCAFDDRLTWYASKFSHQYFFKNFRNSKNYVDVFFNL